MANKAKEYRHAGEHQGPAISILNRSGGAIYYRIANQSG